MPKNGIHHFDFGVAVDALVHPGLFEFVGGDHAVPVLVSEFMLDDDLRKFDSIWHKPTGFAGDERWVFHPAGRGVGLGIDNGQRLIRIGSVEFLETIESVAGHFLVTLGLAPVSGCIRKRSWIGPICA